LEVICTNLLDDPAVRGIVVNGRDVSERKALERELTHRAFYDPLTGLANRVQFHAEVTRACGRTASHPAAVREHASNDAGVAHASPTSGVAVLYIDLDGFKPINDLHGHEAGDHVLTVVAGRLRDATRGSDLAARLGGDEFAILLGRVHHVQDAVVVADRVLRSLDEPIAFGVYTLRVSGSIGVACASPRSACLDGGRGTADIAAPMTDVLLRLADQAMYEAKRHGGRRFVLRECGETRRASA
jgi:diguanylate cyclase (GGDEF)-like protein